MRTYIVTAILVLLFYLSKYHVSCFVARPKPDGRIVGGTAVSNISEIPYQVSLQQNGYHFCGGSLISTGWVLTAAHCTRGVSATRLSIRAGSLRTSAGGVVIRVKRIVSHPKFNVNNIDYDFSLVQLDAWQSTGVVFGTVKLAVQRDNIPDEALLTTSGWGNTQTASESSASLRAVEVPKYNQKECNKIYKRYGGITNRMICAGYSQGGKDACQGDSGGPLTYNGTLVGVVSWGNGCAQVSFPGVYSRVASVRDWIRSISGI